MTYLFCATDSHTYPNWPHEYKVARSLGASDVPKSSSWSSTPKQSSARQYSSARHVSRMPRFQTFPARLVKGRFYPNLSGGSLRLAATPAMPPKETLASKRQRLDGAEDGFAQPPGTSSSGARISGSHSLIWVRNRPSSLEPNTPRWIASSGT